MSAMAEHWKRVGADIGDDADLLCDAVRVVAASQYISGFSYLQRKLRVGFAKASRLEGLLEDVGVIGPYVGTGSHDVLIRPDEAEGWCAQIRAAATGEQR